METHDDYLARLSTILSGQATPTTDELLRMAPFLGGDVHLDIVDWTKREIARVERLEVSDTTKLPTLQRLLSIAGDMNADDRDLAYTILMAMHSLPEEDRDGRLRCRIYRASLGDRTCQIVVASEAAATMAARAERAKDPPTRDDIMLAQSVIGWVTAFSSTTVGEPLSGAPRPPRMRTAGDTAHAYGSLLVEWLREEPSMKSASVDENRREMLRQAGGGLEEGLAADWLGMTVKELRVHTEAGDLIAVDVDGRALVPAFQLKNSMMVLRVREILSVMYIRDPWMRLKWFLTPDDMLGGVTPLDALRSDRASDVRERAQSFGGVPGQG